MLIRREHAGDHGPIRSVLAAAFEDQATPGDAPIEVGLVDTLRAGAEWLPPLSLVEESEEAGIVGYVVCTRGWVDDHPALGLGPLAVVPGHQRRGTGGALMHAVLGAADALDEPLVALLGHTTYYPRFGFRPAHQLGIAPPDPAWTPHFQARALSAYDPSLRGTFRYADAFSAGG